MAAEWTAEQRAADLPGALVRLRTLCSAPALSQEGGLGMINYVHTWKRLRVPVFRDNFHNMYRNGVAGII